MARSFTATRSGRSVRSSYAGQLMVLTYPLVGNYGVPPFSFEKDGLPTYMESTKIHAEAIIVSDYSEEYSHWNAVESLGDWLKREGVPGITGIDTRALTKKIREHGVMTGQLIIDNGQLTMETPDYGSVNYVDRVSCKEIIIYDGTESRSFDVNTPIDEINRGEGEHYPLPAPAGRGSHPCSLEL